MMLKNIELFFIRLANKTVKINTWHHLIFEISLFLMILVLEAKNIQAFIEQYFSRGYISIIEIFVIILFIISIILRLYKRNKKIDAFQFRKIKNIKLAFCSIIGYVILIAFSSYYPFSTLITAIPILYILTLQSTDEEHIIILNLIPWVAYMTPPSTSSVKGYLAYCSFSNGRCDEPSVIYLMFSAFFVPFLIAMIINIFITYKRLLGNSHLINSLHSSFIFMLCVIITYLYSGTVLPIAIIQIYALLIFISIVTGIKIIKSFYNKN